MGENTFSIEAAFHNDSPGTNSMSQFDLQVRSFINDNFLFGRGTDELGSDDSLVENGVIDSTGVMELVMFLEQTFEIKVADDELIPQNLDSINRLVRFIEAKLAETRQLA